MNKSISIIILLSLISVKIDLISCHGILRIPPARSSAWRERPDLFPANYNDYEMNCGGKSTQWDKNSKFIIIYLVYFCEVFLIKKRKR
jgi:hypothetical protein